MLLMLLEEHILLVLKLEPAGLEVEIKFGMWVGFVLFVLFFLCSESFKAFAET